MKKYALLLSLIALPALEMRPQSHESELSIPALLNLIAFCQAHTLPRAETNLRAKLTDLLKTPGLTVIRHAVPVELRSLFTDDSILHAGSSCLGCNLYLAPDESVAEGNLFRHLAADHAEGCRAYYARISSTQ